ncbi:hypothetical protein [Acinetobacter sp.]|uniref:hypothetical protein n=1 Tax=Acinetobacter sp. TaxID=472 RepID=UPI003D00B35A
MHITKEIKGIETISELIKKLIEIKYELGDINLLCSMSSEIILAVCEPDEVEKELGIKTLIEIMGR